MRRVSLASFLLLTLTILLSSKKPLSAQIATESALYGFCGGADYGYTCTDATLGNYPVALLIQASDGDFYSVTSGGGANDHGTLFSLSPSGQINAVYSFCSVGGTTCADGFYARIPVIEGSDGYLYGTTDGNKSSNCDGCGTVFRASMSGAFETLYTFCAQTNCPDGFEVVSPLVQGADGYFYGTTVAGGAYNENGGTVFKISSSGQLTTIYSFCATTSGTLCTDGSSPYAGLVQGPNGNFYGTTALGGTTSCPYSPTGAPTTGCGTIFEITPAGVLTTLYRFTGEADGYGPESSLVFGPDGALYGTAAFPLKGTIFKISTSGIFTVLDDLTFPQSGTYGASQLTLGSDGNFYAVTSEGGEYNMGTAFMMTPSGALTTLYNFCSDTQTFNGNESWCLDGSEPSDGVIFGADGSLYGVAAFQGPQLQESAGEVYKLTLPTSIAPPISLAFSKSSIEVGQSATLGWSVANAYSGTLQQCFAFVQAPAKGAGTWTGQQVGTFKSTQTPPYSGSATITPTLAGSYTYALTCGGSESGFATLDVINPGGKLSTATAVSASTNPSTVGQSVTLTSTVTGAASTPTGSVTFSVESVKLGTATLDPTATATLTASTNGITPGSYPVVATYNGSSTYNTSKSTPDTVTLSKAPTTTSLTANPTSVTPPATVALAATVSRTNGSGTPAGTVTFSAEGRVLATVKLSSGQASFTASTSGIPAASYPVFATYNGDTSDNSSKSTAVTVTVK